MIGLIYAGNQLTGFLESLVFGAIIGDTSEGSAKADTYYTGLAMTLFSIIGIVITLFVKEDLRRFRAESDHSTDFLKSQKNPLL